jgi:geranylgeranyl pyrophosphate synthase
LDRIFGKPDLEASDLQFVRDLLDSYGIRQKLMEVAQHHADEARSLISPLPGAEGEHKDFLLSFTEHLLSRTS